MKDRLGKEISVGDKVAFVYMYDWEDHGIEVGTVTGIYESKLASLASVTNDIIGDRYFDVNSKEILILGGE